MAMKYKKSGHFTLTKRAHSPIIQSIPQKYKPRGLQPRQNIPFPPPPIPKLQECSEHAKSPFSPISGSEEKDSC